MGGSSGAKEATMTTSPNQLPIADLIGGNLQPTVPPINIDPVSDIQQGMGSSSLPIMANSEAGFQQGMKNAQTSLGSPAQLFQQLSPSFRQGNIGGGK